MQRKKIFDSFKHWNVAILSVLMSFCMTAAFAQSGAVKGKVLDELGEPIIGANIVEKGTTNGTITDIDGNYTLSVNDLKKAILQVSFIGYNSVEEAVKGRSAVDVKLGASVVNLGEVVAIGYGTQTRREITGSVANISEENFNKGVNRDASDLLQGKVAGLTITSGSGDVTRSSQIQLRGTSTLQNDQGPMIVIDGVPGGDMSTVSPSDIESISVLKDAASAAIYGSRAAGGVILITTKRGSGSRTQINYDGYLTASTIANKPDMLNASEWRAANKALGKDISTYDKYNSDTDWFDEMTRVGVSQQHALSLSGGSSKSNYRASYTFLDRNGVARDNYMTRHSFRFQFQQRAINDRLRIGLTGAATLTDMQMPFSDDYILAYNMLPVYPVYNADGSYFTDANHNYDQGNPVQNQDQNYKKAANNYFYGQGDVQFSILDGLTTKVNLYKSRFSSDYSEWQDPRNSRGQGDTGKAIRRNRLWDRNLLEWTANYTKAFGSAEEHKVDAIVGYSWENNLYADQKSEATNFAVGSMGADNIQSGNLLKIGNVTSSRNEYKLISLFARAHYSFKERYMITATVRRDGSSKFGANHKWGTFPSVSAAWGISQESFMKDTKWINDLKLRAGYGITGNQDGLRPYKSLDLYSASGTYYNNGSWPTAFRPSQNANPNLKWEETTTWNAGFDFGFLDNRITSSLDYYYRETKDLINVIDVPAGTNFKNRIVSNIGSLRNQGVEFSINAKAISTSDWKWDLGFNVAWNNNEITKLTAQDDASSIVLTGTVEGGTGTMIQAQGVNHPANSFYVYEQVYDQQGNPIEGLYVDRNGDGVINDEDRYFCHKPAADVTMGFTSKLVWKAWDFSFSLRSNLGNYVYNNVASSNAALSEGSINNKGYLSNRPLSAFDTNFQNMNVLSDYYVQNASFLRCDNITLGYSFNKLFGVLGGRIYGTVQNPFVITKYKGLDPEVANAADKTFGIDKNVYPRPLVGILGVSLNF